MNISSIASLPPPARAAILQSLSDDEAQALLFEWSFWARDKQLPPASNWSTWLIMAGRGFGKTRTGAEWIRDQVERGGKRRIALVGRTAADVRDVMVEGESGLLSVCPPWFRPRYEPSKRRVTWPNGAIATTYSGDKPDQLRGPQHDAAWADELAAWRYGESWDQLQFGLRLGDDPRAVVTTTPRPTKLIRDLVAEADAVVTYGHTDENAANLAPKALAKLYKKYGGTRLGRQELEGKLLTDVPGALWTLDRIDAQRTRKYPDLVRIVVAIDPAVSSEDGSSETGLVVAGVGVDGHGYVLDDLSQQTSPATWASDAILAYHKYGADRIVAEANQGGDMIEQTLKSVVEKGERMPPFTKVHASRGKLTRAEPVSALYEQGLIHHVGAFAELEDQMCTWLPGEKSPDRMDALVWALTALMIDGGGTPMSTGRAVGLYQRRGKVNQPRS